MQSETTNDKIHIVYPMILQPLMINNSNPGWELKYSLRSLYENAAFNFDITIIGDIPDWINRDEVKCIEFDNNNIEAQRQTKINQKILKASELYDEFLLFNDDIILMKLIAINELKKTRYMQTELKFNSKPKVHQNTFLMQIYNTYQKLQEKEINNSTNFVTHTPHFYESKIINDLKEIIDLEPKEKTSIVFENAYHAFTGSQKFAVDGFRYGVYGQIKKTYNGEPILNFDEKGAEMNTWLQENLKKIFHQKCKAEK
jgi:hypothetical protein